ncbi:MAG: methyltransferase domain-containing protein [Bacteroidales bacterium]|nr:methyltransferase domain-containing protein [Bacteroidales bacterium]
MKNKIQKRYNRIARVYDILESPMEMKFSKWRKELLKDAEGQTLEVGIGTGKNIPYYPADVKLTGIDFSERMIEIAGKKVKGNQNVQLKVMNAEKLDFEDDAFDTVVTSCVYCSVPDPVQGLKEMKRVCKPNGKILMLEHVRSNHKVLGKVMDILNPIPLYIYGANINRRTYENLLKAGFEPDNIKERYL